MSQEITPATSIDSFVQSMVARRASDLTSKPRPMTVVLNGDSGAYMQTKWNEDKKEREKTVFGDGQSFVGTILEARYYVQSKYKQDARKYYRTREFASMKERVTFLCIDQDADPKTKEIAVYESYNAFKEANTAVNAVTGEASYPFDFHVSLYVYVHTIDQVINIQLKGGGRSAWFDYQKEFKVGTTAQDFVQIKTRFSSEQEISTTKDEKGEFEKYYRASMATLGMNEPAEMEKIKGVTIDLFQWMQAWNVQNQAVKADAKLTETALLQSVVDHEQLRKDINGIPF